MQYYVYLCVYGGIYLEHKVHPAGTSRKQPVPQVGEGDDGAHIKLMT